MRSSAAEYPTPGWVSFQSATLGQFCTGGYIDQGFGLFWDMSDDINSEQRAFIFQVSGCGAGLKCHRPTTFYNTDTGLTDSTGCVVLAPLS